MGVMKDLNRSRKEMQRRVEREAAPYLERAGAAGSAAFARGAHGAPALDREMDRILREFAREHADLSVEPLLKAWLAGWHQANLAAPVGEAAMAFVRKADVERHRAGSLEARVAAVAAAVRAQLGEGAEVIATHADYALVRVPEGVRRVEYQLAEGAGSVGLGAVAEADVPVLAGLDLDAAAADALREAVGGNWDRTRVRDLARMLRRDAAYWVPDAVAACVAEEAPWRGWFEPQGAVVRERLHGQIRDLEAPVPRTRYARLAPEALAAAEAELRESVGVLRQVARGMFDALSTDVAYQEAELEAVHQSLRAEAEAVDRGLAWVERMAWAGAVPVVATAHDRIAARLRDGLVVQAHLRCAQGAGQ